MRFLADESCDFAAVHALRAAGHDMVAVADVARGAADTVVIDLARSEGRVLFTEDKDFGQLVFTAARQSSGVVLVRWPVSARIQVAGYAVACGKTLTVVDNCLAFATCPAQPIETKRSSWRAARAG